MKHFITIILLYLGTSICSAQISALPKVTVRDVDPDIIPKYDSLTNFSSSSDFRYLKGQTLYLAKTDRYSPSYSSDLKTRYGNSSVDMKTIVGKYLRVEDVQGSKYSQRLVLRDTANNEAYTYKMFSYSNNCWVVMGYYEKMREKYEGKDLYLMKYDYSGVIVYKDYPIYNLSTHRPIKDIKLKTRWKCTGLSVDTELSDSDVKDRVILLLENDEYGQCYCYLTSKSDILNKKNEYKRESSYSTYYIADKFMPGEVYQKQQKQAQAKLQAEAEAEKKAQQQRVAKQKAAAESNLKSLQKH